MEIVLEKPKYIRPNPEKDKQWRLQNKERLNKKSLEWSKQNKERLKEYRITHKEKLLETAKKWQKENRKRANQHSIKSTRKRRLHDSSFKFLTTIRALITKSFKRGKNQFRKTAKSEEILGCTIKEFIKYILSKCPENTKLEDFKQFGYHIDHIIPISSAKTKDDVIKLNHYTNFQPLWWKDNLSKSNKILI